MKSEDSWDIHIRPNSNWIDFDIKEIWRYRDLTWLFVWRDVVTLYKQTILGPLWYFVQPLLTTLMFVFVFSGIANLSTDGLPPILFYISGITVWGYFSDCLNRTSNVFVTNQHVFGKVYFPRITVPVSIIVSTLLKFFIQFTLFISIWSYYFLKGDITPNLAALLLPLVIFNMALLSLGLGMIFSSLTTKYKDLQFLLSFAVQLWMYITPIIYPLSSAPASYSKFIQLNPLTHLVEGIRYGFLGKGVLSWNGLAYSMVFTLITLFVGMIIFSKVEKSFMDTV